MKETLIGCISEEFGDSVNFSEIYSGQKRRKKNWISMVIVLFHSSNKIQRNERTSGYIRVLRPQMIVR